MENELTNPRFPTLCILHPISPRFIGRGGYIYILLEDKMERGWKQGETERDALHSDDAVANLYFRLSLKRDKLIKVIHGREVDRWVGGWVGR